MVSVGGEPFWCGEGNHDDGGITKPVEVIAHGDHVFLARQSSEVSVQDQHKRMSALVESAPGLSSMVNKFNVGKLVADAQGHEMLRRASSIPRWNVG